ncbi:MAG: adenine deaminase C-terminal domain-containing protein [Chloroflexota bacterium]
MQPLHFSQTLRRRLRRVALAQEPAEIVIQNARVVNVFTGEILPDQSVAIAAGRIARVDSDVSDTVGAITEMIDADGQTLVPGFIDTHCHLLSTRYSVPEFLKYAVPGGTTLIVTETIEFGSLFGLAGIRASLDALANQPIKLLATIPALAALQPYMEAMAPSLDEYRTLLLRPDVVGLGETYWGNLLRDDARLSAIIEAALDAGKTVEGHSAGARGAKLQAYACEGISSCHEPITAEEGLARLRLGLHFMIRDGEIRQDLEAIAPLWKQPVDHRRMILVTDSVGAERLMEHGYLEHNVQRAIGLGLDPVKAIQMVTINPAEHFALDQHVGSIAPGRCADMVLLPTVREIKPSWVMSDGRVVARAGTLTSPARPSELPAQFRNSIRLHRRYRASDFSVPLTDDSTREARVIDYVTGLVTQEGVATVRSEHGVAIPQEAGLCIVACIDRARGAGEHFVGWARGFGLRTGALATTWSWDSASIIAIGANPGDMALAVQRVAEVGGAVVVANGEVRAEVPAPIGGIISEAPMESLVAQLRRLKTCLHDLGCPWPDPLLAADVLTTAAIPHFRITDRGYVRVRDGALVQLWVDESP